MKIRQRFNNRLGLAFGGAALLIETVAYILYFHRDSILGDAVIPLLYSGFGIPFLFALTGQALAGCDPKMGGCFAGGLTGFSLGFLLVPLLYYGIGLLLSAI